MVPAIVPQLVANDGTRALRQAIAEPDRFAYEPKVDGVRGLVVYQPERVVRREAKSATGSAATPSSQGYDGSFTGRLPARTPNPARERRSEAESENVIVLKPLAAATATLAGESSI